MKRAKKGGAQLQCVNNHFVKYEYKGMNTVGVTNYKFEETIRVGGLGGGLGK